MSDRSANTAELHPWPTELCSQYQQQGLWQQQNLAQWLALKLNLSAGKVMLSGPGVQGEAWQQLTGQQLWQQVLNTASHLHSLGLRQGDKIVMQMANNNSFILTLFALLQLGVVPVMALPGHGPREIQHFVALTQAKAWFVSAGSTAFDCDELGRQLQAQHPSLQHIIVDGQNATIHIAFTTITAPTETLTPRELSGSAVLASDIAVLLCSGGTTGIPKLIPRTHRDYLYNAKASAEICNLSAQDSYLVALPAAHNFPLACPGLLGALEVGASIVMCPIASPDIAFDCIERAQVTVTALVPTLLKSWLEHAKLNKPPAQCLRLLQVGGAKLDERMARRVNKELGCGLQQVFGMAEGLLNFTRETDQAVLKLKTQGKPMSDMDELRIVDEQGQDVPKGKTGELLTRGPYTIRGYYKDPLANQKSFTSDGYYCTGDRVRQLSSGHLIVEGRIKEVIRRAGEAVSAETLETVLACHPAIRDVAVVGLPCEELGEKTCAALVLTNNQHEKPTLLALRQYLSSEGLARHMLPDVLAFVAEIPLTAVGKIARKQLAAQILQDC